MKIPKGYDGYDWVVSECNEHRLYGAVAPIYGGFERRYLGKVVQGRFGWGWKKGICFGGTSPETLRIILTKIEELQKSK